MILEKITFTDNKQTDKQTYNNDIEILTKLSNLLLLKNKKTNDYKIKITKNKSKKQIIITYSFTQENYIKIGNYKTDFTIYYYFNDIDTNIIYLG